MAMAHILRQYREGVLCGSASFFDGNEGVDGKGMPQGMGSGCNEAHIAHHLSRMSNAHLPDRLMKEVTHLLISEGF